MRSRSVARRIARVAMAVGLVVCAARPGSAQQDELARVRSAFPGGAGERIVALIEGARHDGVPASLLVMKALEGAQKSAPPDRVLRAVAEYAEELREARAAVGRQVGDEALKEAADALGRGVPASAIRSLARSTRGNLSILFVALFDLMDQGVPPGPAEALVEEAARRGVGGDRLLSLPASVQHLMREGLGPTEAADSVRRALGGGQARLPAVRWNGDLAGGRGWPPHRRGIGGRPSPGLTRP